MPKRKHSDGCDRIQRKIRRLEKKLQRKRRRRRRDRLDSSESQLSSMSHTELSRSRSSLDKQGSVLNDSAMSDGDSIVNTDIRSTVTVVQTEVDLAEPVRSTRTVRSSLSLGTENTISDPPISTHPTIDPPTDAPIAVTEVLDSDLLDILGTDPTNTKKYGKNIHKDVSARFQHCATSGLAKELRKELKDKYLTPENCQLIDPPELNAEIKAAVSDTIIKRDKAIESKQKQLASAIASLGEAITLLLTAKEKNNTLLKLLMDSARIMCDCQHADTVTRRNFLLGAVKSEIREQLQNTKVDKLLFGENLAEVLKSAKAIHKSGIDLKPPALKPQHKKSTPTTSNSSRNLNVKHPGPVRRLTGPPRMKEPAMTSTRNRPANLSKQSQHPQPRTTYNRR